MPVKQMEQRAVSRARGRIRTLAERHSMLAAVLAITVVPGLLVGAVFLTTLAIAGPIYLLLNLF